MTTLMLAGFARCLSQGSTAVEFRAQIVVIEMLRAGRPAVFIGQILCVAAQRKVVEI